MRITYMTDVEGNWEYFLSYVALSEGLELDYIHKADKSAEVILKEARELLLLPRRLFMHFLG
eukprot:3607597-Pleurochrysis_carterae.AAC.3